jgi:hypothetical protein
MWKLTLGYGIRIGFYLDKIRGKIEHEHISSRDEQELVLVIY